MLNEASTNQTLSCNSCSRLTVMLLYQFRVMVDNYLGTFRKVEESYIPIEHFGNWEETVDNIFAIAKRRNVDWINTDGNKVFYEFLGVLDYQFITSNFHPCEFWRSYTYRKNLMANNDLLLLSRRNKKNIINRMKYVIFELNATKEWKIDFNSFEPDDRFAIKLLFQYRTKNESHVYRKYEYRMFIFNWKDVDSCNIMEYLYQFGNNLSYTFIDKNGNKTYYEFIDFLDCIHWFIDTDDNELWYDYFSRKKPKENKSMFVISKKQLIKQMIKELQTGKH